jgi:threonyl-tRNA synthetase
VRAGWALQYNYVLVVGDKELSTGAVSVRPRGANDGPSVPLESFIADLTAECAIPDL